MVVISSHAPTELFDHRRREISGLASALEPAMTAHDGIWLGWSGCENDSVPALRIERSVSPARACFDMPASWRKHFYDGFCSRALWPALHSFPSRVCYRDADWAAYVAVNETYARFALELVAHDGVIWVHDYHLLLAARALRRLGYRGPVGLFLHAPFPTADVFETLPWCDEVLAAMREFDLLAFHTQQWADNFRACSERRIIGQVPALAVLPFGIDPQPFQEIDPNLDSEVAALRAALGASRMILGVDRLDYAKGIPQRLLAFDQLLERYPEWRGEVSFIQVSVPTRVEVPEYAELRQEVEELVGRINGRYGEADWVPVRYLYRAYDQRVLAQLYRSAAVGLVTPLRDGMNLVAKEFVASQDEADPGVLVLSRFAGAAAELSDAVITNPYHPDGLAADLDRALRMSRDERARRHAQLIKRVRATSPERWAAAFLDRLAGSRARI